MKLRNVILLLTLAVGEGLIFIEQSIAQTTTSDNIVINADQLIANSEKKETELIGRVQIAFAGRFLKGDRAIINSDKKTVYIEGNVELSSVEAQTFADRALINYETQAGTFYNAFIVSGQVTFEGVVLHRLEDGKLIAYDGKYTACNSCPEPWLFHGRNIEAEIGGYAFISQPILRAGGVPIFWLPYLVVPLKSERQTGLLFPGLSFLAGGLAVDQTLFIAIDEHQDATLTARYFDTRGLQGILDYKYKLSGKSEGSYRGFLINQKNIGASDRLNQFVAVEDQIQSKDRWFIEYKHRQNLPNNFVSRVKLELTSDLSYINDYPWDTFKLGESALENVLSLSQNKDATHFRVEAGHYRNLLKTNALASNEDAVHRLPEIHYQIAPYRLNDYSLLDFKFNYTQFTRDSVSLDQDILPNGEDLIRTGQRVDLQPTLSVPLRLGSIGDALIEAQYRETHYLFQNQETPINSRRFLRTKASLRTNVYSIYNFANSAVKHELIPDVTYTYIPWFQQEAHPFFNNRSSEDLFFRERLPLTDLDVIGQGPTSRGLQFDSTDRIYDRNLVTVSLFNKLIERTRSADGTSNYQQFAYFKLSQSFDVFAESQGDRRPLSDIEGIAQYTYGIVDSLFHFNYYPYFDVTNLSSRVRFYVYGQNYFELGNRLLYSEFPDDSFIVNRDTRNEDIFVNGGVMSPYLDVVGSIVFEGNEFRRKQTGRSILSWEARGIIKPPGNCWGVVFRYLQPAGGVAISSVNLALMFDGKSGMTF